MSIFSLICCCRVRSDFIYHNLSLVTVNFVFNRPEGCDQVIFGETEEGRSMPLSFFSPLLPSFSIFALKTSITTPYSGDVMCRFSRFLWLTFNLICFLVLWKFIFCLVIFSAAQDLSYSFPPRNFCSNILTIWEAWKQTFISIYTLQCNLLIRIYVAGKITSLELNG